MTRTQRSNEKPVSKGGSPWLYSSAFFLPLILASAYLNMGPTCCGSNCPPPGPTGNIYPNHVSIDAPVLLVEGLGESERAEPYFVSFSWEATSWKGFSEYPAGTVQYWLNSQSTRTPSTPYQLFANARQNERILLGEDISKAVFDFPEVPFTEAEAATKHVKIAGLTMCAFEQDDGNNKAAIKREIELKFATPLRDALKRTYAATPFSSDSTLDAFRTVYRDLKDEATTTFAALPEPQKTQSRPLYEEIIGQLDFVLEEVDGAVGQKDLGASAILSIIGAGLKVVTNLVSLFKKSHTPDNDDFVGCGTIVYVGMPHALLDQQSTAPACSSGGGGLDMAVCAIDAIAPTNLAFAPPFDAKTPTSVWSARVESRKGTYRTSTGAQFDASQELRGAAHAYQAVPAGETATVEMPKTKGPTDYASYPPCQEGVQQRCNISFAHMVDYRTNWDDWLEYQIIEKSGNRYEIKNTSPSNNRLGNVGVRLSTVTLPSYVNVKREVVELTAVGSGTDAAVLASPVGFDVSPNWVTIPEILSIEMDQLGGNLAHGVQLQIARPPGFTVVTLQGSHGCQVYGAFSNCVQTRVKVRLTYLYWDETAPVDKFVATVTSDDNENTPPEEPELIELAWSPPVYAEPYGEDGQGHTGVTLYYPTELWSGGDVDTAFSVRAVGTEVSEFLDGEAKLYVQDSYTNEQAQVTGEVLSLRFQ